MLGPKLLAEWDGPYSVITKIDELTYELSMPDHPRRRIKRHINLLKEFNSPTAACLAISELTGDDLTEKPEDGGESRLTISRNVSAEEREQLEELLARHGRLIGQGCAREAEIKLEIGDAYPISRPPYRLDPRKLQVMNEEIKKLLEIGVIRPSKSPWAPPALLVGKKDGGVRLCIDYRRLNAVTKSDPFPLPRIDELIDKLGQATHISTLDLERGYHQIIVYKDSVCKTAFITLHGKWEYVRMPFGMKNAPSVFQRLMNSMLADMARFSAAYIDDIVVFSKTFEEHIVHLEAVYSRLEETGLGLKPTKCKLAEPTCQYLGHRVGAEEVVRCRPK